MEFTSNQSRISSINENNIRPWKEKSKRDIDNLFTTQVSQEMISNMELNPKLLGQHIRYSGIKLGNAPKEFVDNINDKVPNLDDQYWVNEIKIHLAISHEKINFIFEYQKNDTKHMSFPIFENKILKITEAKRNGEKRIGISPELVNQLRFNWRVSPFAIGSLFYSFPKSQSHWFKAFYYTIRDTNLQQLRNLLNENSELYIYFGLNTTNLLESNSLFSLILEVKNAESSYYIDFVKACPPNCPNQNYEPDRTHNFSIIHHLVNMILGSK